MLGVGAFLAGGMSVSKAGGTGLAIRAAECWDAFRDCVRGTVGAPAGGDVERRGEERDGLAAELFLAETRGGLYES